MFLILATSAPLLGMSGGTCTGNPMDPNGCQTTGKASVRLTLTDDFGIIAPQAAISLRINNAAPVLVTCEGGCEDFPVVFNAIGKLDLSIHAPGYLPANRTVNVISNDNCNPVTENLIVVLEEDLTVAALAGAWRAQTVFGVIDLRFNTDGSAVGAILYDRTVAGDGNFYVSYNGSAIRGAPNQSISQHNVSEPTRNGDVFDFNGQALGVPVGFSSAQMSGDFSLISGLQPGAESQGIIVTYQRLAEIPLGLQTP